MEIIIGLMFSVSKECSKMTLLTRPTGHMNDIRQVLYKMTNEKYPLITASSIFDAVILCDGDYPSHAVPLSLLNEARYLVCCDGAGMNHILHGGTPDAVVGDGDSLPEDFKRRYADILHIVNEQEDNDQTKATRFCMERGCHRIAYLGSTGKREDHALSNISLIMRYMRDFHLDVTMVTDNGYFTPASGTQTFESFPCQQISIFNFGCTRLEGEGFKWSPYPYKELWQGSLNEAVGESVTIKADGDYLLFRTFEPKKLK